MEKEISWIYEKRVILENKKVKKAVLSKWNCTFMDPNDSVKLLEVSVLSFNFNLIVFLF